MTSRSRSATWTPLRAFKRNEQARVRARRAQPIRSVHRDLIAMQVVSPNTVQEVFVTHTFLATSSSCITNCTVRSAFSDDALRKYPDAW